MVIGTTELGPLPDLQFDVSLGSVLGAPQPAAGIAHLRQFFEDLMVGRASAHGVALAAGVYLFNVGNYIVELKRLGPGRAIVTSIQPTITSSRS